MKVYLVTLSGVKDIDRKLVNEEAFNFILNGGEPPESVIADFLAQHKEDYDTGGPATVEFARRALFVDPNETSTPDNDRALAVAPSHFNGETCGTEPFLTVKQITVFVARHGLDLQDDEYEGGLY